MAVDIQGEERIAAPIAEVWAALNDADVLRACIPGCEIVEKTSETGFTAIVALRIGPIKARLSGQVELQNLNPPHSCTIAGERKSGAGVAKGGADVVLREDGPDATILTYRAKADVRGMMAKFGARLIQSTLKKLAGQFFSEFNKTVSALDIV